MPKSESQIGLLVTKAPPRRGPWPGRQESDGKGRARSTDFPFMIGGNDKGPTDLAPTRPSHPPPLQPTSNASGLETSRGDGLALSGSPLRITPTHTVKSNPPFLCVLLSLSVLWAPIVYGFYAPEAFFVITMDQSLHEKHYVGGTGRRCQRETLGNHASRLHGKSDIIVGVAQKQTLRQRFENK